jgi:peptidoglycan/LPS O-acetylase OafA/YrhL
MTSETHRTAEHRRDLDLLRVLIVFGLVFFHTARIFDTLPLPEGVRYSSLCFFIDKLP